MAGRIFISYRRGESACAARAVFERLRQSFGQNVFIDLEGISPGIDFLLAIDQHLEDCDAMLAMIGPQWLQGILDRNDDHSAHQRNNEDGQPDHVRLELARALAKRIPVVPVLVDGSSIPAARNLPAELKALARRNAVELPWKFFDAQMNLLERELRKVLPASRDLVAAEQPPALSTGVPQPAAGGSLLPKPHDALSVRSPEPQISPSERVSANKAFGSAGMDEWLEVEAEPAPPTLPATGDEEVDDPLLLIRQL